MNIPEAIARKVFMFNGIEIVCHALEDGSRIIEASSMANFIKILEDPSAPISIELIKEIQKQVQDFIDGGSA